MLYVSCFMTLDNPLDITILFFSFMIQWWWLVAPLVLFFIFWEFWLYYIKTIYLSKMSWTLLEISVPKEVFQTPKAIENIFSSLHSISSPPEFWEKYWKGVVQGYLCLEIVGQAGKSHFYIRTPSSLKNYVSSQIYAHYPKAEIKEVPDYVDDAPKDAPNADYDLWGTEMTLTKEDGYPIRTYVQFEEVVEEKRIDPISSIMESFAQLGNDEQIWIQILIRPAHGWEKEGQKLIDKLIGKKTPHKENWADMILNYIIMPIEVLIGGHTEPPEKKDSAPSQIQYLSPGQKEVVEAIEKNISKIGFNTIIRTVYVGKRSVFNRANVAAIVGFFKQFNTLNLNGFKPNMKTFTKAKYPILKKQREYLKKRNVYMNYRMRLPGNKNFTFNTEELATIFHFPATVVEAPTTPRIEAKKAEPPANLPI